MAYLPAPLAVPGSKVEIEVRGKHLTAAVTPMPFVPHRYHRQGAQK
jgi:glycine cleavage system T protein (aminomethyltransferase)